MTENLKIGYHQLSIIMTRHVPRPKIRIQDPQDPAAKYNVKIQDLQDPTVKSLSHIGVGMRGAGGGGSAPPLSKVGGQLYVLPPPPLFIRELFVLIGPFNHFGAWLKLLE